MKKILVLIPLVILLASCGTPRNTNSDHTTKAMKHGGPAVAGSDEVVITGTQNIPIHGRNEAGVRADLEGTWILQSGVAATNSNNITAGKSFPSNTDGKTREQKRDSSVSITKDGTTQTTTIVYMENDGRGNKITPPQSSNPNVHVPEKPSLRFYGSNETFSGFTGCNKISGRYTLSGNSISFQHSAPSTKMACIGEYDETAFLAALKRVNAFKSTSNQLELLDGDDVVLVLSRTNR